MPGSVPSCLYRDQNHIVGMLWVSRVVTGSLKLNKHHSSFTSCLQLCKSFMLLSVNIMEHAEVVKLGEMRQINSDVLVFRNMARRSSCCISCLPLRHTPRGKMSNCHVNFCSRHQTSVRSDHYQADIMWSDLGVKQTR